jgi:hypothetical protein
MGITLKPTMMLLMELMPLGTLHDLLYSGMKINWKTRISLAIDIARGVAYLHSITPRVIHRDLNSRCILLTRRTLDEKEKEKVVEWNHWKDNFAFGPLKVAPLRTRSFYNRKSVIAAPQSQQSKVASVEGGDLKRSRPVSFLHTSPLVNLDVERTKNERISDLSPISRVSSPLVLRKTPNHDQSETDNSHATRIPILPIQTIKRAESSHPEVPREKGGSVPNQNAAIRQIIEFEASQPSDTASQMSKIKLPSVKNLRNSATFSLPSAPTTPIRQNNRYAEFAKKPDDEAWDVMAKIGDYNLALRNLANLHREEEVSDSLYSAPEVMIGDPYTEKADCYALGILLWEIWCQKTFLDEYTTPGNVEDAIIRGLRPSIPQSCHPEYANLIRRAWDTSPDVRPSSREIVEGLEKIGGEMGAWLPGVEVIEHQPRVMEFTSDFVEDYEHETDLSKLRQMIRNLKKGYDVAEEKRKFESSERMKLDRRIAFQVLEIQQLEKHLKTTQRKLDDTSLQLSRALQPSADYRRDVYAGRGVPRVRPKSGYVDVIKKTDKILIKRKKEERSIHAKSAIESTKNEQKIIEMSEKENVERPYAGTQPFQALEVKENSSGSERREEIAESVENENDGEKEKNEKSSTVEENSDFELREEMEMIEHTHEGKKMSEVNDLQNESREGLLFFWWGGLCVCVFLCFVFFLLF